MPVSMSISLTELNKLRNQILSTGLKKAKPTSEYELLRVEDGDIRIIVYKSGKLVHNNTKASRELIDSILEQERKYDYLLGSDEVGKGEWYGPLIVACAALTPNDIVRFRQIGVRDSKLIGKNEIKELASELRESRIVYHDVTLMPETYNAQYEQFQREGKTLNDLLAWWHATAIRATLALIRSQKTKIIIDKFDVKKTDLRLDAAKVRDENVEIIQSSKGDTEIPISVASILAKDMFETRVDYLNKKFSVDLRTDRPEKIGESILPQVAKLHFSNVQRALHSQVRTKESVGVHKAGATDETQIF